MIAIDSATADFRLKQIQNLENRNVPLGIPLEIYRGVCPLGFLSLGIPLGIPPLGFLSLGIPWDSPGIS